MSLIPYRRSTTLSPLGLMEDFFDSPLFNLSRSLGGQEIGNWLPNTDVHDAGDKLIVKTDLPGLEKDDIEVSVHGKTLYIKGEKKHEEKVEDMGSLRTERYFGHFERAIPLTEDISSDKVEASYKNGVLTVTIPKSEESKPKQIKVDIK